MSTEHPTVWYRFFDVAWGEEGSSECNLRIELRRYYVVATTRCGLWLSSSPIPPSWAKRRILYPSARRPWAWPTIPLAWESYRARKKWQVGHLEYQLSRAQRARALATEPLENLLGSHAIWLEPDEKAAIGIPCEG